MKKTFVGLLVVFFLGGGGSVADAAKISISFFYDALEPYGDWMETTDFGYVWHPRDVDENWRPYTIGSWAYTDAGWTWISDEPFGWATCHYGRWADLDRIGWVWVPDQEWGPAWGSWRHGGRFICWAAPPPGTRL